MMTTTAIVAAFTADELKRLEALASEVLDDSETPKRPRLAKKLTTYARHLQRIHTILLVLDPAHTGAVFNPKYGTEDTLRAEMERRRAELPALETALRAALAKEV